MSALGRSGQDTIRVSFDIPSSFGGSALPDLNLVYGSVNCRILIEPIEMTLAELHAKMYGQPDPETVVDARDPKTGLVSGPVEE